MALTDNLQGYWSLENDSWLDETANNNDLTGNNTPAVVSGKIGNALDCNASEYLSITNAAQTGLSPGNADFSGMLWVNMASVSGTGYFNIMGKWESTGNQREYSIALDRSTDKFEFYVSSSGAGGGAITWITSPTQVKVGEWYCIFYWHDAANNVIGIQVNNEIPTIGSWAGGVYSGTADFEIGSIAGGTAPHNGQIDEVAFWDRIITPRERDWLYNYFRGRQYSEVSAGITNSTLGDTVIEGWELNEASSTTRYGYGAVQNLANNGSVVQAAGRINKCADFELADAADFLSVADNTDLSFGDVSFSGCLWLKGESFGADAGILTKWNSGGNDREYALVYDNAGDRLRFQVSNNGTAEVSVDADTFGAPSTGVWLFVYFEHDATGNTIGISVNNGTIDTTAHTTGVNDGASAFHVGATNGADLPVQLGYRTPDAGGHGPGPGRCDGWPVCEYHGWVGWCVGNGGIVVRCAEG
jgi:hypothetical protein